VKINLSVWTILKFLKYLLIPLLLFFYLGFADLIATNATAFFEQGQGGGGSGGIEVIGVGFAATVSVTRPYFFGLIRLPVYAGGIGDISGIHNAFFMLLGLITVAFVAWDAYHLRKGQSYYNYGSKYQWRKW